MENKNRITRREFFKVSGMSASITLASQAERVCAQTPVPIPAEEAYPRTPFSFRAFLPIIGVIAADAAVLVSAWYLFYRSFLRKS